MKTEHTPGVWHVEGDGKKRSGKIEPDHIRVLAPHTFGGPIVKQIAVVYYGETDSEREANARLIASAPELLTALEFLLADYTAIGGPRLTHSSVPEDIAVAAIAKAKGTQ